MLRTWGEGALQNLMGVGGVGFVFQNFRCFDEASVLMGGGVSIKVVGWPPPPTMGNPVNRGCFLAFGNTKCSQTLTKQTNAQFNMLQ